MKFSIINIKPLSGKVAKIYSIKFESKEVVELQNFIYKFSDTHGETLDKTIARIQSISNKNGLQPTFFRRESPTTHNVYRLLKTKDLRIYCIIMSNIILVFGSGGRKIFGTTKLSQNPHLKEEVDELMKIEDSINERISKGQLRITNTGFEGNLLDFEI